mgnify:CR=1 FL=1
MDEDTDMFEKLKELEGLVYTHENVFRVLVQLLKLAGYDEDPKGKTNEAEINRDTQNRECPGSCDSGSA